MATPPPQQPPMPKWTMRKRDGEWVELPVQSDEVLTLDRSFLEFVTRAPTPTPPVYEEKVHVLSEKKVRMKGTKAGEVYVADFRSMTVGTPCQGVLRLQRAPPEELRNPYNIRKFLCDGPVDMNGHSAKFPDNAKTVTRWLWWNGSGTAVPKGDLFNDADIWNLATVVDSSTVSTKFDEWVESGSFASITFPHPSRPLYSIKFHTEEVEKGGQKVMERRVKQFRDKDPFRARTMRPVDVLWQWDAADRKPPNCNALPDWMSYSDAQILELENAYTTRNPVVTVEVMLKPEGGAMQKVRYEVNLVEMVQFKLNSHFKRRYVRRFGPPLEGPQGFMRFGGQLVNVATVPSYWDMSQGMFLDLQPGDPNFQKMQEFMDIMAERGHGVGKTYYGAVAGSGDPRMRHPRRFKVVRVQLVQKMDLWEPYNARKQFIISKHGEKMFKYPSTLALEDDPILTRDMVRLDRWCNEYYLFHGTGHTANGDTDVVTHIMNRGFDNRHARADGMFGRCTYFADLASKSNQYVSCPKCFQGSITRDPCKCPNVDEPYRMIIARVALGKVFICDKYGDDKLKYVAGEDPCPAVLADESNSLLCEGKDKFPRRAYPKGDVFPKRNVSPGNTKYREMIIYHWRAAYPEFVVHYKREL